MRTLPRIWRNESPDTYYASVEDVNQVEGNGLHPQTGTGLDRSSDSEDMVLLTATLTSALQAPGRTVEVEIANKVDLHPSGDQDRPERGDYDRVWYDGSFSAEEVIVFEPLTVDMENVRIGDSSNTMLNDELEIPVVDDIVLSVGVWGGTTISVHFAIEKVHFYRVSVEDVIKENADKKIEDLIDKTHSHEDLGVRISRVLHNYHDCYYDVDIDGRLPVSYIRGIVEDFAENKGFQDEVFEL